jgi:HAMP domain-containing protein
MGGKHMEDSQTQFTGAVLAAATSLMGAYLLTLRIREALAGRPDAKPAAATKAEVESLRGSFAELSREVREGSASLSARSDAALATIHELVRRNAEHIAVLIAQNEMLDRRLTETVRKVERLGERIGKSGHPEQL